MYPNAQRRKVRPFEGMTRKAVVVMPDQTEYKARVEAQLKAESKDVPDSAVMEMKGISDFYYNNYSQFFLFHIAVCLADSFFS